MTDRGSPPWLGGDPLASFQVYADLAASPNWQQRLVFRSGRFLQEDTGVPVASDTLFNERLKRAVAAHGLVGASVAVAGAELHPTDAGDSYEQRLAALRGELEAAEQHIRIVQEDRADLALMAGRLARQANDWTKLFGAPALTAEMQTLVNRLIRADEVRAAAEGLRPAAKGELLRGSPPWRVGNRVQRTIYDHDGELIGVLDTAELAQMAVDSVNVISTASGNASPRAELAMQVEESRREIQQLSKRRDELAEARAEALAQRNDALTSLARCERERTKPDAFLHKVCELLGLCETPEGQSGTHYASEETVLKAIEGNKRARERELERAAQVDDRLLSSAPDPLVQALRTFVDTIDPKEDTAETVRERLLKILEIG